MLFPVRTEARLSRAPCTALVPSVRLHGDPSPPWSRGPAGGAPVPHPAPLTEKYRTPSGSCRRRSKDTAQLATLLSRRRRQLCTLGRLALLLRLWLLTQSFRSAPLSSVGTSTHLTCTPARGLGRPCRRPWGSHKALLEHTQRAPTTSPVLFWVQREPGAGLTQPHAHTLQEERCLQPCMTRLLITKPGHNRELRGVHV